MEIVVLWIAQQRHEMVSIQSYHLMMFDICTVKGLQQRIEFEYLIMISLIMMMLSAQSLFPSWRENFKLVVGLHTGGKF
jgi:hypothetical protein